MSFADRYYRPRRIILVGVLLTVVSAGVLSVIHAPRVQAAPPNPTVLIATDVTSTSACSVTYYINIAWHSIPPPGARPLVPWIKTLPCPAGTIIKTSAVPLSQALAQHERYVPLPANPRAPTTAEQAATQTLLDAKQQAFAPAQSTAVPLTGCGNASYASRQWSDDNVGHFSEVWWYRTSNCTQIYLDQGYLSIGFYPGYPTNYWYWSDDAYYNTEWGIDVEIAPYSGFQYNMPNWVNPQPPQHWYRQYVYEWLTNTTYDVSIVVLN